MRLSAVAWHWGLRSSGCVCVCERGRELMEHTQRSILATQHSCEGLLLRTFASKK